MEEVYKDRDQFASLVREVAAPDVGRMGIEVLSFTIKDVYDNVTYLASLGNYFIMSGSGSYRYLVWWYVRLYHSKSTIGPCR